MSTIFSIRILITNAREGGIAPKEWRIFEAITGEYELQFSYDPERKDHLPVRTRDGKQKIYKSMNALMADIKRVQTYSMFDDAIIHYYASKA